MASHIPNDNVPTDSPPAYDVYADGGPSYSAPPPPTDQKVAPALPLPQPRYAIAGPAYAVQPAAVPGPTVYHYTNRATGEHLASLLPPNHPEMVCLQEGAHVPQTRFGFLGLLAAIVWFPLGIGLCLLDRRVKCARCGMAIDDGVCG